MEQKVDLDWQTKLSWQYSSYECNKSDNVKTKAIIGICILQNKVELPKYLEIVPCLAKFIAILYIFMTSSTMLLNFSGQIICERAFAALKALLNRLPLLRYYVGKMFTPSIHAKTRSLGAILLQDCLLGSYASEAMTTEDKNDSYTEKETLAILSDCTRFHQFIYQKIVKAEDRL